MSASKTVWGLSAGYNMMATSWRILAKDTAQRVPAFENVSCWNVTYGKLLKSVLFGNKKPGSART